MDSALDPDKEEDLKAKLFKREALYKKKLESKGLEYDIQVSMVFTKIYLRDFVSKICMYIYFLQTYKPKSLQCEHSSSKTGLESATNTDIKSVKDDKKILRKIKKSKGIKKVIKSL